MVDYKSVRVTIEYLDGEEVVASSKFHMEDFNMRQERPARQVMDTPGSPDTAIRLEPMGVTTITMVGQSATGVGQAKMVSTL